MIYICRCSSVQNIIDNELIGATELEDVDRKELDIRNRLFTIVESKEKLKPIQDDIEAVNEKVKILLKEIQEENQRKEQEEKEKQAKEREELKKRLADSNIGIQDVEGIGPTTARKLKELGIVSPVDLVTANIEKLSIDLNSSKEHAANIIAAAKKLLEEKEMEDKKQ